jgi:hypothetical protein
MIRVFAYTLSVAAVMASLSMPVMASLSPLPVMPIIPILPILPAAPDPPITTEEDEFVNAAVDEAVTQIDKARRAMRDGSMHCTLTLTDGGFENGHFSQFFQLVCTLIVRYFEEHGFVAQGSSNKDKAIIRLELKQ